MSELTEFLLARIAEDEAIAQAAIEDDCNQDGGFEDAYELFTGRKGSPLDFVPRFGDAAAGLITHTAVPRRVLAECEAKRRIVRLFAEDLDEATPLRRQSMTDLEFGRVLDAYRTLVALAAIYADHPDYQQEWVFS